MIDLHLHSIFSDGTFSPEELISMAQESGVSALALTDHDTTAGLGRFFKAAESSGVEAVAGIELSAEYGELPLHILGYFFDPANEELQTALEWVRDGRAERNEQMLEKLNRMGYKLTMEEIARFAGDELIGRPHFAAALVDRGYFNRRDSIFQQLLGKGKAAYVDRRRLTPEQCVELISLAGGVPAIAHPGQMRCSRRNLRRLVKRLKPLGLGGLEVWHSTHQAYQAKSFLNVCNDYDLAPTGGSDFHGAQTPDLSVGKGFGNLCVEDSVLDELRKRSHAGGNTHSS